MAKSNPLTRAKHKQAWDCFQARQLLDAKKLYQQICEKDRRDEWSWTMLGITHGQLNELDDAETCLRQALSLNPDSFDALTNYGLALYCKGLPDQAVESYRKALGFKPDHVDTLVQLGNAYARMDQLTQAQQCYERVLRQNPQHTAALGNLANVLAYQGRAEQAIPYFHQLLNIDQRLAGMHSNLLLCLHYCAAHDPSAVFQEHLRWAAMHARGVYRPSSHPIDRSPDRKLRLGYVTPDMRGHSVAYFLEPLLAHHDRTRFEIYCYEELVMPDATTRRLWKLVDALRNTHGQSDDQVAVMVRNDQIDILIDLAGHTENNRLLVFARKPAPIQITYLGYPNTTGLQTVDYRLTDEWADPPGMTEHLHTERLVRLKNGFLCFSPPAEAPAVEPLPAAGRGYVTFGSFNVLTKITAEILEVWARILLKVPGSRLLIKNRQLTDTALQERLYAQFEQHGVTRERVDMLGRTAKEEHMASYGKVDIALDTFPYNGTTTTCDTLWMGIPVITRAGRSHVSRVGVSLLTRVGISELIANTEEEYIEHAVRLANDLERLSYLRQNLRKMVESSGLCDGPAFTSNMESVYRQLWQAWCEASQQNT